MAHTSSAAMRCELATSSRCRCRCGGAYHGAHRVDGERRTLHDLALGDPHRPKGPPRWQQPALFGDEDYGHVVTA